MSSATAELTIRRATPGDDLALARLAAIDSRPAAPAGPLLLALVDGDLHAAVAITDGDAIADPFRRTSETVELLRLRSRRLRGDDVPRRQGLRARLARTSRLTSTA